MRKNNVNLIIDKEKLLKDIKERVPVSQGNLRNSISIITEQTANSVLIDMNSLDYFKYVDQGRKPGKFPPPSSLQNWVLKNLRPSPKELKSVTYLVARSIARNGIKGKEILKDLKIDNYITDYEVNLE